MGVYFMYFILLLLFFLFYITTNYLHILLQTWIFFSFLFQVNQMLIDENIYKKNYSGNRSCDANWIKLLPAYALLQSLYLFCSVICKWARFDIYPNNLRFEIKERNEMKKKIVHNLNDEVSWFFIANLLRQAFYGQGNFYFRVRKMCILFLAKWQKKIKLLIIHSLVFDCFAVPFRH